LIGEYRMIILRTNTWTFLLALLTVIGCSSSTSEMDAGLDAGTDAGVDAGVDAGKDAGPDGGDDDEDQYLPCKPILPDHNGPADERVNWVFVGYQFPDLDKMRRIITDAVDYSPGSYWSLMNVEPFKSNRDKINLWYVDKLGVYEDMESIIRIYGFEIKPNSLLRECPQFTNQYVVIFQDTDDLMAMATTVSHSCAFGDCTNTSGIAPIGRGYIWMFSKYPLVTGDQEQEESSRHYLTHEWGHIFGGMPDQYINISTEQGADDDRIAGNALDPKQVCSNWCEGPFSTYAEVSSHNCSVNTSMDECNREKMAFQPCYWHNGECVNVVAHCAQFDSQEDCLSQPFCGFLDQWNASDWHAARCFPWNSGLSLEDAIEEDRYDIYVEKSFPVINVGSNCLEGTGCYTCGERNMGSFRADAHTAMRQDFLNSYGVYLNAKAESVIEEILSGQSNQGFWEFHGP
jgi:hypothetical protein